MEAVVLNFFLNMATETLTLECHSARNFFIVCTSPETQSVLVTNYIETILECITVTYRTKHLETMSHN